MKKLIQDVIYEALTKLNITYSEDNVITNIFQIVNAEKEIKLPIKNGIKLSFIFAFSSALAIIIKIPCIEPTIIATPIDTTISIFVSVLDADNMVLKFN